jgi:broad specificity phosphatase PhoE
MRTPRQCKKSLTISLADPESEPITAASAMASHSERRRQGRRQAMAGLAAAPFVGLIRPALSHDRATAGQDRQAIAALQSGGLALIRHAMTVPGVGDPPNFRLGDCSTQRNLSPQGREQSRAIGRWFLERGLRPDRVRSSQWCRCLETASEAFRSMGRGPEIPIEPWAPLNSFFQGQGDRERQLQQAFQAARTLAQRPVASGFEVWVTHQVTVTGLTGQYVAMGEMLVVSYDGPNKPLKLLSAAVAF